MYSMVPATYRSTKHQQDVNHGQVLRRGTWCRTFLGAIFFVVALLLALGADAATVSIQPTSGTFTVNSTFDVSIYLDTDQESVNALQINLIFPPDLMQLVSPEVSGRSVVQVWTSQPRYNNQQGTVELIGGIPGGLRTDHGLVATLRFRVRSVGSGTIRFGDQSQVLRNDGKGTNVLTSQSGGLYQFTLPPPAGPLVASETHSEQTQWYASKNTVLRWEIVEKVQGFSYILSRDPTDIPDDISEGDKTSVAYRDLDDGVHYFHIKALREIGWGGTTHFAVKVDTVPPAEFTIEFDPGARTTQLKPIIKFASTDSASGLSHYELKIIPLSSVARDDPNTKPLFIEALSPFVPGELGLGSYDVIVRAYDKTGNYRESTERLKIVKKIFRLIGDQGLEVRHNFILTWPVVWGIFALLLAMAGFIAWRVRRWHHQVITQQAVRELPTTVRHQLEELKKYHRRYGKLAALLLAFTLGSLLAAVQPALAAEPGAAAGVPVGSNPPLIDTVSKYLTNKEIFYVGGATDAPGTEIVLYLQNVQTGETTSYVVPSGEAGVWFYRHHTFLPTGTYLLWVQGKLGDRVSAPSPQAQLVVDAAALQFGTSRVSYEALYLILLILFGLVTVGLVVYTVYHARHARRKHLNSLKEIREAEESVRRGFAVLRRDIEAELKVVRNVNLSKRASDEGKERERQLLEDLADVEKYISKEIWDVEQVEQ